MATRTALNLYFSDMFRPRAASSRTELPGIKIAITRYWKPFSDEHIKLTLPYRKNGLLNLSSLTIFIDGSKM